MRLSHLVPVLLCCVLRLAGLAAIYIVGLPTTTVLIAGLALLVPTLTRLDDEPDAA